MARTKSLQVGDWGIPLRMTFLENGIPFNIAGATQILFKLEPPDGSATKQRIGQLDTDGSDGAAVYVLQVGDLDELGKWRWQVTVTGPNFTRSSKPRALEVTSNVAA